MNKPRNVIAIAVILGLAGAAGQLWLMQFGALASAPLRGMLSMVVAITIGVLAGTQAKTGPVKVAMLMGVVAGAILTSVGLAALMMNPELAGQRPFDSVESFLVFVSSILMGTVISSWLIAGIAALVTWPISLAQATEEG
jgi:hypothetical protein